MVVLSLAAGCSPVTGPFGPSGVERTCHGVQLVAAVAVACSLPAACCRLERRSFGRLGGNLTCVSRVAGRFRSGHTGRLPLGSGGNPSYWFLGLATQNPMRRIVVRSQLTQEGQRRALSRRRTFSSPPELRCWLPR